MVSIFFNRLKRRTLQTGLLPFERRRISPPRLVFISFLVVILIGSILPLVPGGPIYYTMLGVVQGDLAKAQSYGVETLAVSGTITVGIFLVSMFTRIITGKR